MMGSMEQNMDTLELLTTGSNSDTNSDKEIVFTNRRPIALSLFSGAGGMDVGVSQAGFNILASIEIDHNACETLRHWNTSQGHSTEIVEADIRNISPNVLMKSLGLAAGDLDLLVGGPPCQSFSLIGKRGSLSDERGLLLFQMVRFAKVFLPRTILIEQVQGVLSASDQSGAVGGVFKLFTEQLKELGYDPKHQVINSADYGVPQLRQRVFIVATLSPNNFRFPEPTHTKASDIGGLFSLLPYVTVEEAFQGLGTPALPNEFVLDESHIDVTPPADRRRIHDVPEGSYLAAQTHLPAEQRGKLTKRDSTKFRRLSYNGQSLTLRCGEMFYHPIEDRYCTPREYLRLHGYPSDFRLVAPVKSRSGQARTLDQHRLVANSVPPPVAKKLAESILRLIECRKSSSYLAIP